MAALTIGRVRPWGDDPADIVIRDGRIVAVRPAGSAPAEGEPIDGAGSLALPGFVNAHAHVDKSWWGRPWVSYGGEPTTQGRIAHERAERDRYGIPGEEATVAVLREFLRHGTTATRSHVDVDLGVGLREAARRAGATVNDVLLVAIADAVRTVAARRGERLRRVVASVPMTGRPTDPGGRNQVGAFLISIPERLPDQTDREFLGRLAVRTRRRKLLARGSSGSFALSAVLVGLGRLGWYRPMFERQRAITTLVTNLRGPVEPLTVHGVGVRSLTPISPALGNVTMVFAAVSHAGRLRVTARLDRSVWGEQDVLTDALRAALTRLAASRV